MSAIDPRIQNRQSLWWRKHRRYWNVFFGGLADERVTENGLDVRLTEDGLDERVTEQT